MNSKNYFIRFFVICQVVLEIQFCLASGLEFLKLERDGILLKYDRRLKIKDVYEVAEITIREREKVRQIFGEIPSQISFVIFATTGDFTANTKRGWWIAGVFEREEIMLQPPLVLKKRGILKSTIIHELSHSAISIITKENCPVWLSEGLACYMAGEEKPAKSPRPSSISNLEDVILKAKTREEEREARRTAFSAVNFFVDEFGESKIRDILNCLKEGLSFEIALQKTTGTELKEFERRWRNKD